MQYKRHAVVLCTIQLILVRDRTWTEYPKLTASRTMQQTSVDCTEDLEEVAHGTLEYDHQQRVQWPL